MAYANGRIQVQQTWYSAKATSHRRLAAMWGIITAVIELGGLVAAVLRLASAIEFDWLGILSTIAAGIVAWLQTQQHEHLARAYAIASHELSAISDTLHVVRSEDNWAALAEDAEAAISREHTLWLASRGRRD